MLFIMIVFVSIPIITVGLALWNTRYFIRFSGCLYLLMGIENFMYPVLFGSYAKVLVDLLLATTFIIAGGVTLWLSSKPQLNMERIIQQRKTLTSKAKMNLLS